MNKIAHLTIFLSIVSAVAGGALALANQMTAPVIAANNERLEKESLQKMYPEASESDFELVQLETENANIQKVYRYQNYLIFNMSVPGYKEGTTFLVSIDTTNQTIDDYYPLSNGDTKGLGSKVMEPDFEKQLEGKSAASQLDTISGATITSQAVTQGINEAAQAAIQEGGQ